MTEKYALLLLFEKIANDDQKSLESLFNLFYKRLFNFITSYIKNKEASEEAVSDVFFRLWQQRKKLGQIKQPEIYLFVCAKNAAIDYTRKSRSMHVVYMEEPDEIGFPENTDPLKELEKKELHAKMDRAIELLPVQCKAVFRLVKQEGFTCKEVARIMDISSRTVETHIYKAVKRLDEILSGNQPASPKGKLHTSAFYFFLFCNFF